MSNFDIFDRAVAHGNAYRVSKRQSLDDGQEFIIHFQAPSEGGSLFLTTPAINTPQIALVDVYENADPGTSTVDDLLVHNMRYDVATEDETPDSTVLRVSNGGLDTSTSDKTEETQLQAGGDYQTPGDESRRGLWRIISGNETVSMVITDNSGGTANVYGFDMVLYEDVKWD